MRITDRKRAFHRRVTKHSQNVYTMLISTDLRLIQKLKTLTSPFSILTQQNPVEITRKALIHCRERPPIDRAEPPSPSEAQIRVPTAHPSPPNLSGWVSNKTQLKDWLIRINESTAKSLTPRNCLESLGNVINSFKRERFPWTFRVDQFYYDVS